MDGYKLAMWVKLILMDIFLSLEEKKRFMLVLAGKMLHR